MPWLTETADEIPWDRLGQLMAETVSQARRRICARPRRVLLLPPDITRAHSGVGRLTEMIYQELAGEADVRGHDTVGERYGKLQDALEAEIDAAIAALVLLITAFLSDPPDHRARAG